MTSAVRDNPSHSRFEMEVGGELAVAYYSRSPGLITFTHTEVPQALSGHGIGSELARGALEIVRSEGDKSGCEMSIHLGFHRQAPRI